MAAILRSRKETNARNRPISGYLKFAALMRRIIRTIYIYKSILHDDLATLELRHRALTNKEDEYAH